MAGAFQGIAEDKVPDASSTTRIVQQVGGSFGAAALAVVLAHGFLEHGTATAAARGLAFNTAFWWATGFTLLALVPALVLPTTNTPKTQPGSSVHAGR